MKKHARHVATGAPIPDELIACLHKARRIPQGFLKRSSTPRVRCSIWRCRGSSDDGIDITQFERDELGAWACRARLVLRHRLPHFFRICFRARLRGRLLVYMWAEVLEADGYDAFVEAGDPFDPPVAGAAAKYVYSSGNTIEPRAAYRAFRGRDAAVEPLLRGARLISEEQPA